ncbi:sensor histidine kinase [Neorhodopirellula lusitana]|nr:ATP-binding protein [Neorhodopirellula lusitana]
MTDSAIRYSLRQRIYAMCAILMGVCVFSTLILWVNQARWSSNFEVYEQSERTVSAIREIDRDIQELKAQAEKYLQTGGLSQLAGAISIQETLLFKIDSVIVQDDAASMRELLQRMRLSLVTFDDQLEQAADERELRTQLVQVELPIQDAKVNQTIDELQKQVLFNNTNRSAKTDSDLIDGVQAYLNAQQSLQQYFINPQSSDFDSAIASVSTCRQLMQRVADQNDLEAATAIQKRLDQELAEFIQLGTRAFQATRSYMFYSNIVMAGEISEFTYYSNRLKDEVEVRRNQDQLARNASNRNIRIISILTSIAAIALAAALATRLSLTIVSPLSSITETFRRLGSGETIETIPALDRNDEIGRMAQAAQVFSDRNRETQELLVDSERLRKEVSEKASALEEMNEELDHFAYVASHDLKSPLRGINHLATWVREDCSDLLPEESNKHLLLMQERVKKMEALLDDLLNYSRVGRVEQHTETVDVGSLLATIISMVDPPEGFRITAANRLPVLQTFRTPLEQVLRNLINNAVKYNDKGGQGTIEVKTSRDGDVCRFAVRDNGPGIDPRFHQKVFEMYQRIAIDVDGTGMGLAIAKKQINNLGGDIWIESSLGEGATFIFTWPAKWISTSPTAPNSSVA